MHRGLSSVLPAMSSEYAPMSETLPEGSRCTASISSIDSSAVSLINRSSVRR